MQVIVAGHICLDIIPDLKESGLEDITPGHITEVGEIELSTGGAVANTGIALSRLGIEARLVGKIGGDPLSGIVLNLLEDEGPSLTENMIRSEGETTSYSVVLNPLDTDRAFLHHPGPNDTFRAGDIPYDEIGQASIFHFGYPPLMQEFYSDQGQELGMMLKKARKLGLVTSLDMAMPDPESPSGRADWETILDRALPHTDIFQPSLEELLYMVARADYEEMMKTGNPPAAGLLDSLSQSLLDRGARIVIIKLGEDGLYMKSGQLPAEGNSALSSLLDPALWSNRRMLVPCFAVEPAGTTGAGDAAIAGLLSGLLAGNSPEEALTTAAAVGACSVEDITATGGIPAYSEVRRRIASGWEKRETGIILGDWLTDRTDGICYGAGDGGPAW